MVRQYACPCCAHWLSGKSALRERPVAYRDVIYAGNGGIRVSEPGEVVRHLDGTTTVCAGTVHIDALRPGQLLAELRLAVAKVAAAFGMPANHDVIREVIRTVIKFRIPPAFAARAKEWQEAAAKWARHVKAQNLAKERAAYVAPPAQHEGRTRAPWIRPREYTAPAASYEGRTKRTW